MGLLHYLNVRNGDCTVVQHPSGHVTVIDVNNAGEGGAALAELRKALGIPGNFNQKEHPVDPIEYLRARGVESVFRFIVTHPDMDHIGGIKAFFGAYPPLNLWDTNNLEEKTFEGPCPWNEDDWYFYKAMRDTNPQDNPKRLVMYAEAKGKYFNQSEAGESGGDGLYILAPTPQLEAAAQESGDCNEYSYILLYKSTGGRILIPGDSHDAAWDYILANHDADVRDIDVLIAPHHGRHSGRSFDFLDILRPRLTLFGNASSEHLAYDEWSRRGLPIITNNQANCVVLDTNGTTMTFYVTNETFAQKCVGGQPIFSAEHQAYYCGPVPARD